MANVDLYSVEKGELARFDLEVDRNGEIVAARADNDGSNTDEFLKFPAGLTPNQFKKLVDKHNKVNDGVVAISPNELEEQEKQMAKSQELLEILDE